MNRPRLLELFWEFASKLEELHTLYLDSVVGYSILHERLNAHQDAVRTFLGDHECATEAFQDTCSVVYKNLSNRDITPVSMSPVMKQGDMKQRVADDGRNTRLLGNQCVVSAYAYWEEYLRLEIGKAIGVLQHDALAGEAARTILNKHVKSDLWGDIRHIRNSALRAIQWDRTLTGRRSSLPQKNRMRVRKLSKLRKPRALALRVWMIELKPSAAALVMRCLV